MFVCGKACLPDQDTFQAIRAAKAEVREGFINSPIGWSVNEMGYIIGRHLSDSYQDPPLAFPALEGPQLRTTLVKGDDGLWYILELSEPLRAIAQLDAKFHDMVDNRSVITIVFEGEKYPIMMCFQFDGGGGRLHNLKFMTTQVMNLFLPPRPKSKMLISLSVRHHERGNKLEKFKSWCAQQAMMTLDPASQAMLASQSGPYASRAFTTIPYSDDLSFPSHLF